jgi:hypothetical protein
MVQDKTDLEVGEFSPYVFLTDLLTPLLSLPTKRGNREIARLGKVLAQKINRQRGDFSVSYLKGAYAGEFKIGKPLKDALLVHSLSVLKGSPIKPILEEVTVLVYPGFVEEESIIKTESRRCAHCNDPFLPVVWNDRHCSKICAAKGKAARQSRTFVGMVKALFSQKGK